MPTYSYKARDINGKVVSGSILLDSDKAVREHLRQHNLFVTSLALRSEKEGSRGSRFTRRVKLLDLILFSRQFASMLQAGVAMTQTLTSLAIQAENPRLREATLAVQRDIENGSRLSVAMARHPQVFPEVFVSLVMAGEAAGDLPESLERLAVQFDKEQDLREKVKSAFIYPSMVLAATAVVVTIMLTFVVPVFARIYQNMHAELPAVTRMLIGISYIVTHYAPLVVGGMAGVVSLLRYLYATEGGRYFFDRLKLRLPILGRLNRKIAVARFIRTLASLLHSGVPLPRGLEIAAIVAGNRIIGQAIQGVVTDVTQGSGLAGPLARTGEFPEMVTRMVAVGEQSGALQEMLTEVAHFYDRDVEYTVKRLTTILEPILTGFLSVVVGFVVIALYLPIFGLVKRQ